VVFHAPALFSTTASTLMPRLRSTPPLPLSWPVPLEDAPRLLGLGEGDWITARARLHGRGLVHEGVVDLASPLVAEVLALPVQRARRALADAVAEEREAIRARASRNIARRCGVFDGR